MSRRAKAKRGANTALDHVEVQAGYLARMLAPALLDFSARLATERT